MKYWWITFLVVFALFINSNRTLFYWFKMEGAGIASPSTINLVTWWIYLVLLFVLLLVKFVHERKEKEVRNK